MLFSPLEGWRTAVEVYEMYCYYSRSENRTFPLEESQRQLNRNRIFLTGIGNDLSVCAYRRYNKSCKGGRGATYSGLSSICMESHIETALVADVACTRTCFSKLNPICNKRLSGRMLMWQKSLFIGKHSVHLATKTLN